MRVTGSGESPATGWHCPLVLLWPPAGCSPPSLGLTAGKGPPHVRLLLIGFCTWKQAGGGGVSTGTLPRAQRDSCPSSWRTDLRRSRHLACPFVELAKRDSCQAHSAKVQEYFKILPLLQPQLLLWPLKPAGGAGFLFGCAQPPGRKIPKEGLNQSQLNSLALY